MDSSVVTIKLFDKLRIAFTFSYIMHKLAFINLYFSSMSNKFFHNNRALFLVHGLKHVFVFSLVIRT